MKHWRALKAALPRLLHRKQADQQLNAELRYHLDEQIEANIAAGMPSEEARRQALLAFGGAERFKEECRDARPLRLLDEIVHDVRFGARLLRRGWMASLVVGLSMTVGIGSCTAILTFLNGILLQAPPLYRQPEQLVLINETRRERPGERRDTSAPVYRAWAALEGLAEGFAAVRGPYTAGVRFHDYPVPVTAQAISPELLPLLGVAVARGRNFLPEEYGEGAAPVALISHQLWQRQFGGSPAAIGAEIWIEGRSHGLVGVLPDRFWFYGPGADIFVPLRLSAADSNVADRRLKVAARLRRGVSRQQLGAGALAALQAVESHLPAAERGAGVAVVPLLGDRAFAEQARGAIWLLTSAVFLTLVVVCVNVAIAMTARWTARQKELAVRAALGAGRARLVRQFLVESSLLAMAGGAGGLLVTWAALRAALLLAPPEARFYDFTLDPTLLCFTAAVSLLTGMISGVAPALLESRANVNEQLKQGASSGSMKSPRQKLRRVLVASQVAVTFALLVIIASMVRGYLHYQAFDPGFDKANVLTFRVRISDERLPAAGDPRARRQYADAFYERVSHGLRSIPEVESVAYARALPLWEGSSRRQVALLPAGSETGRPASIGVNTVSEGYFQTVGIRLLRGRLLAAADAGSAAWVAVVNRTLERIYFPQGDALGEFLRIDGQGERPRQIVGIVDDTRNQGILREPAPVIYVAHRQQPPAVAAAPDRSAIETWFLVRGAGSAELAESVRKRVAQADADQVIAQTATIQEILDQGAREMMAGIWVIGGIIAFALFLSALGVHGVMSYAVSRRTAEIGVRMALGAGAGTIFRLILGEGLRLSAAGLAAGAVAAFAGDRIMGSQSDVSPAFAWPVFAAAALVLLTAALAACYFPARRATKVDPMLALRAE